MGAPRGLCARARYEPITAAAVASEAIAAKLALLSDGLPPAPAMLADGDPQAALGVELLRLRDMLREGLRDMDITDLEAAWRRLASAARPAGS
jgi:hypothetical protein